MMKSFKKVLLLIGFLTMTSGMFAQGLYGDQTEPEADAATQNATLYRMGPPPDGEGPKEPGESGPIGDALWVIVGLAGIYVTKKAYDRKKQEA